MMEAVAALAGILAGALACLAILRLRHSGALRSGEELLETSRREAEDLRRETEIRLKDEEIRRREELERQADRMREEWEEHERRMSRKEALFDRKFEVIGVKENHLEEQARRQQARQEALDLLEADRRRVLEETKQGLARVSGLSREQAAEAFIQGFEDEMREECASRIRRMQERAEEEAEMRAQKILGDSVQRLALSYCAESVTSTVVLPNDDMKGRIIG
ncbi:MAG: DUF3552 domain-containing protein, partial [Planctomycetes bacterium]|nr:DUF3552 domain-containing protein [Planctomycetota bacterium]